MSGEVYRLEPGVLAALRAARVAAGAPECAAEPDLRPPLEPTAAEEHAALSVALRERARVDGSTTAVVFPATMTCDDYPCSVCDATVRPFPSPSAHARADFVARNAVTVALEARFDPALTVAVPTEEELRRFGRDPAGFSVALAAAYPGSGGLTFLGRVGFSRGLDLALVRIGRQCTALGGEGFLGPETGHEPGSVQGCERARDLRCGCAPRG